MKKARRTILASIVIYAIFSTFTVASDYPGKPIQCIVPFDPGTASDQVGRLLAKLAEPYLGVKIQIVNISGGSGARGFTQVHKSRSNGYVIGVATTNLATHKIFGNLDFDHNDFDLINLFQREPAFIGVHKNSISHDLGSFIVEAKKHPGKLSFATSAPGGVTNIIAQDFFRQAGIEVKTVPSPGGGVQPVILASGGHVDACVASMANANSQLEAGNIRPLAVYMEQRYSRMPNVPSFAEEGFVPTVQTYRGIIAPKGTPQDIIAKLRDAFEQAINEPSFKAYCDNNYIEIIHKTPDEATALFDEIQKATAAIIQ